MSEINKKRRGRKVEEPEPRERGSQTTAGSKEKCKHKVQLVNMLEQPAKSVRSVSLQHYLSTNVNTQDGKDKQENQTVPE